MIVRRAGVYFTFVPEDLIFDDSISASAKELYAKLSVIAEGRKPRSGWIVNDTNKNLISELRSAGWIENDGDVFVLMQERVHTESNSQSEQ